MGRYKFVNFVWLSMDEVSDGLKAEIWIDAVKLDVYGYRDGQPPHKSAFSLWLSESPSNKK